MLAAALVGYIIYRHRSSSSNAGDTSGTPGPDQTGSASLAPSGGAASVPGNLPDALLTAPDTLQQQVQQADTTSSASPTMTSAPLAATPQGQAYVQSLFGPGGVGTIPTVGPAGGGYVAPSSGSIVSQVQAASLGLPYQPPTSGLPAGFGGRTTL